SLGNESGYGPNFAAAAAWLHAYDPTRPIHYEGAQDSPRDPATVDVVSRFYPRVADVYLNPPRPNEATTETVGQRPENARWERLVDLADNAADDRPILASEYAHAMGNALGNLAEYWDEIDAEPRLLGGFIWDWADQGLFKPPPDGAPFVAYGGDFGDRPNLGAFCLNGVVAADRQTTPKYWEGAAAYQPVRWDVSQRPGAARVRLVNRFFHTDLSAFALHWQLLRGDRVIRSGELALPATGPGDAATVELALASPPGGFPDGDYFLRASLQANVPPPWAAQGHEFATVQIPWLVDSTAQGLVRRRSGPPAIDEGADAVACRGDNFKAVWSRRLGTLSSLVYQGRELLAPADADLPPGPTLQAYRAPTDNDRGFGGWLAESWRVAGLDRLEHAVESFAMRRLDDSTAQLKIVVRSRAAGGEIVTRSDWQVTGDGRLTLSVRFEPSAKLPPLPRIGLRMFLSPDFERLAWFGHGPHENYPDRLLSSPLGIWRSTVAEQYVAYARPQETGNKEGVRWLALADQQGAGLLVVSLEAPISASALHVTAEDLASVRHAYELKQRPEVVLSLDARQCGLGNSSCGPGVLRRYAVLPQPYEMKLALIPLAGGDDPGAVARQVIRTAPSDISHAQ
ncbi:MAG: DUF4981 domain-containing protein, partial [Planctomycetales bacterium]|nr:DUF4981 domain-containing protein [Planctomycetales bacterium]